MFIVDWGGWFENTVDQIEQIRIVAYILSYSLCSVHFYVKTIQLEKTVHVKSMLYGKRMLCPCMVIVCLCSFSVVDVCCACALLAVVADSSVPPSHEPAEDLGAGVKHRAHTESHPAPSSTPPLPPSTDLSPADSPNPMSSKLSASMQGPLHGRPRPIPKKPTAGTAM